MINLFFMNPVSYGGHVTFTVHLMRSLRAVGQTIRLFKVGNRTELFERNFGYEESYRNLCLSDAKNLCKKEVCLITAPSKPKKDVIDEMLKSGSRIVIHDPAEFKHGWDLSLVSNPIIIRKSMRKHLKDGIFIPHPYDAVGKVILPKEMNRSGISISRIDFDKHTELLLDANRLLPKRLKICIRGFENRIYTRFNIMPKYPEWVQSRAAYPRELRYAYELCKPFKFMLDMSIIKQDGGGTQYTFLEAIDAGCVCVVNKEWIIKNGVMKPGVNCLAVSSAKEIVDLIKNADKLKRKLSSIRKNAYYMLKTHEPKKIGRQYARELLK